MFEVEGDFILYRGVIIATFVTNAMPSATEIANATQELRAVDPDKIYTQEEYDDHGEEQYREGFSEGEAEKGLDTKRNGGDSDSQDL